MKRKSIAKVADQARREDALVRARAFGGNGHGSKEKTPGGGGGGGAPPTTLDFQATRVLDSFQNFALRLGVGTDDLFSAGSYGFNPVSRVRSLLEWIHRGSWLGGLAVDLPAEDMTRAGVEIQGELEPGEIEDLKQAAIELNVWNDICDTIKWARLYGGCIAVCLVDGQNPSTEFRPDTVGKNAFRGLMVLDRWMIDPSLNDLVQKPGPHLGQPKYYTVLATSPALEGVKIHHSRCLRLEGLRLPYWQRIQENLWGISVLERLYDRMLMFDSATQGIAQLLYKSYLRTYKIKDLREAIAAGGPSMLGIVAQVEFMRKFQSQEGITLMDAEDDFAIAQATSYGGISDVIMRFGEQISGALQIPLVRLFGQSPAGFSATGESDLRTYYDGIRQQQVKHLQVPITVIYQVLARHLGIKWVKGTTVEFNPLWQLKDEERAAVAAEVTQTVTGAVDSGLVAAQTGLKELKQSARVTGVWSNITDDEIENAEELPAPPPEQGGGGDDGQGGDNPLAGLMGGKQQGGEKQAPQEGGENQEKGKEKDGEKDKLAGKRTHDVFEDMCAELGVEASDAAREAWEKWQDDFKEQEHPREKTGKFTKGHGVAMKAEPIGTKTAGEMAEAVKARERAAAREKGFGGAQGPTAEALRQAFEKQQVGQRTAKEMREHFPSGTPRAGEPKTSELPPAIKQAAEGVAGEAALAGEPRRQFMEGRLHAALMKQVEEKNKDAVEGAAIAVGAPFLESWQQRRRRQALKQHEQIERLPLGAEEKNKLHEAVGQWVQKAEAKRHPILPMPDIPGNLAPNVAAAAAAQPVNKALNQKAHKIRGGGMAGKGTTTARNIALKAAATRRANRLKRAQQAAQAGGIIPAVPAGGGAGQGGATWAKQQGKPVAAAPVVAPADKAKDYVRKKLIKQLVAGKPTEEVDRKLFNTGEMKAIEAEAVKTREQARQRQATAHGFPPDIEHTTSDPPPSSASALHAVDKKWAPLEGYLHTQGVKGKPKVLGGGIARTYIAKFADGTKGMWKPDPTQGRPEVQAFEMAKLVNCDDIVRAGVWRGKGEEVESEGGRHNPNRPEEGAMLEWMEDGDSADAWAWAQPGPGGKLVQRDKYDGKDAIERAAGFDFIFGNPDRHGGNWWCQENPDGTTKITLIDQGLMFSSWGGSWGSGFMRKMHNDFPNESPAQIGEMYAKQWPLIENKLNDFHISQAVIEKTKKRIDLMAASLTWDELANQSGRQNLAR